MRKRWIAASVAVVAALGVGTPLASAQVHEEVIERDRPPCVDVLHMTGPSSPTSQGASGPPAHCR